MQENDLFHGTCVLGLGAGAEPGHDRSHKQAR